MKSVILVLSILIIKSTIAQNAVAVNRDPTTQPTVIVHKDFRFDEMAAKQAELNKRSYHSGTRAVRGFRIQAANTQNREEANAVKAELLRRFPDQKSYLLYQAPNFRVRLGNFLTQRDAFQIRKMISGMYPGRGIYIVPDVVEYTPPTTEDDSDD